MPSSPGLPTDSFPPISSGGPGRGRGDTPTHVWSNYGANDAVASSDDRNVLLQHVGNLEGSVSHPEAYQSSYVNEGSSQPAEESSFPALDIPDSVPANDGRDVGDGSKTFVPWPSRPSSTQPPVQHVSKYTPSEYDPQREGPIANMAPLAAHTSLAPSDYRTTSLEYTRGQERQGAPVASSSRGGVRVNRTRSEASRAARGKRKRTSDTGEGMDATEHHLPPSPDPTGSKLPCIFRAAQPLEYTADKGPTFSACHTSHSNPSDVARHLQRPPHCFANGNTYISDQQSRGICKRCWRPFDSNESLQRHLQTDCPRIRISRFQKWYTMLAVFCWLVPLQVLEEDLRQLQGRSRAPQLPLPRPSISNQQVSSELADTTMQIPLEEGQTGDLGSTSRRRTPMHQPEVSQDSTPMELELGSREEYSNQFDTNDTYLEDFGSMFMDGPDLD